MNISLSLFFCLFMIKLLIIFILLSIKEVHPLLMGGVMLLETLFVVISLNIFNKSSVFSLIIFLIMIGGVLILFLYFNMFAINMKMMVSYFYGYNILVKLIFFLVFLYFIMEYDFFNYNGFMVDMILEMGGLSVSGLSLNNDMLLMLYLNNSLLVLFLLLYLLNVLVLIVKILFYYNLKSMHQMI